MAPREHISYWTLTHCSSPSTTENSPTSYFCSTIFQDLNRQQLELTYWSHGHTSVGTHEAFAFFVFHVIFWNFEGYGFGDPTTHDRMRQMNIPWECGSSGLQSILPLPLNQYTCLNFSTSENLLCQTHEQKWEVCSDCHIWYLQVKVQPMRVLLSLLRRVRRTQTIARTAWREVYVSYKASNNFPKWHIQGTSFCNICGLYSIPPSTWLINY